MSSQTIHIVIRLSYESVSHELVVGARVGILLSQEIIPLLIHVV
jgi:hypothetical protein